MLTLYKAVKCTMPNYRVFDVVVDQRTLNIAVKPKGMRGNRLLRWWPYWSGSRAAIEVDIVELKREGADNELTYELHSTVGNQSQIAMNSNLP